MNKGKMILPKMSNKAVWLGCYFNHYNAIVIFSQKPHYTKAGEGWQNMKYDYVDLISNKNKKIIAGVCFLDDFKELFPSINISELIQKNGNVISTEPSKLVKAEMTAMWDKDKLRNIDFSLDGFQYQ